MIVGAFFETFFETFFEFLLRTPDRSRKFRQSGSSKQQYDDCANYE